MVVRHVELAANGVGAADWDADHTGVTELEDRITIAETSVGTIDVRPEADGDASDPTVDATAAINAKFAALGVRGGRVGLGAELYRVTDTLEVGRNQTLEGVAWEGSRLQPDDGMTVPVVDLTGDPGTEGASIRHVGIEGGGSAGVPAIRCGASFSYMPIIDHCRIEFWAGKGIDVGGSVHPAIRDTRVVNCTGDGIMASPEIGVIVNSVASNGGANGFVLSAASGTTKGSLIGCSADSNAGHGYYITGGHWYLQVYGENNTGDVLHVDGMVTQPANIQLNGAATAGATSLTIDALTKPLWRGTILRFGDGTATFPSQGYPVGTTSINLGAALGADQADNAVATIDADDVPIGALPMVVIGPSNLNGTMYFNACRVMFLSASVPSQKVTATTSARLLGDVSPSRGVMTSGNEWGGGGSPSLAAALGETRDQPGVGMAHVADPTAEYQLTHGGTPARWISDGSSTIGTFYIRLASQFDFVETAVDWTVKALPVGSYLIRAHVRDASQTSNNVQIQTPAGNTNFTTATTGWEWVTTEYTHTQALRDTGTGQFIVQRQGASNVDIDAIVIVPKAQVVSSVGVVQSGRSTTANRPDAANVGIGGMWFDTTLGQPIWSDGADWVDATGASV